VRGEQAAQRLAQGPHRVAVVRRLQVRGREPAGEQQAVAPRQGRSSRWGRVDEELPARPGAPLLDEAEVLRRDVRLPRPARAGSAAAGCARSAAAPRRSAARGP
jgi:hypothetical protein